MEIRSVENEVKNEYPKLKQVSKKHLLNSIPNKWMKVGLSSLGITMIMKSYAFATMSIRSISDFDFDDVMDVSGGFPTPISISIRIFFDACRGVQIISALVLIITGLSIFITKIKSRKQSEPIKVKKWVKVIFIISIITSIIMFILCTLPDIIYYIF